MSTKYFLETEATCEKCDGTGEIPADGLRAIQYPNSKWNCGRCRGKGYVVGQQEVVLLPNNTFGLAAEALKEIADA